MLTEIRSRATGWIAWFIVILISIPFALWGVNTYFEGAAEINVAVVNGEEIDQRAYRDALEVSRARLGQLLGDNADPELTNSAEFKNNVLTGLITQVLLSMDADQKGYRFSDAQLRQFIQSVPAFQRDNRFASDLYESAARSQGYSVSDFEQRLRRQNVIDQIRIGFTDTSIVTDHTLDALLRLALQRRHFDYATVRRQEFIDRVEISEAEIEKEYNDNAHRYQEPEKIKVQFVRLAVADLEKTIALSEPELRQIYETNKDRYRAPEQRKVSHILITVPQSADEDRLAEALSEASALAERARGGEDFAELAREHSQDPGSAPKGGDLGVLVRGVMVKPFEEAVYRLRVGEVSGPVKTRFGYHVIKLTDLVPESVQTFEQAREQIEREERRRLSEAQFIEQAETFRNLVYEEPQTLAPVAEELGLSLGESDWFSVDDGTGIAANARLREAAFSNDVFIEGLNSETVEIDANTLVAVRKLETQTARQKPLDDVRADIERTLRENRARERARQLGAQLLSELEAGGDWEQLLSNNALQAEAVSQARHERRAEPNPQVVAEVFRARPPQSDQPVYGGVDSGSGDYVLFRLTKVEDGDPVQSDSSVRDRFRAALERRNGYDFFLSYQQGLRDQADIKKFTEQL